MDVVAFAADNHNAIAHWIGRGASREAYYDDPNEAVGEEEEESAHDTGTVVVVLLVFLGFFGFFFVGFHWGRGTF